MTQPTELFDLEEMLSPPGLALLSVMTALTMAVDRTLDMPTRTALAEAFEEGLFRVSGGSAVVCRYAR